MKHNILNILCLIIAHFYFKAIRPWPRHIAPEDRVIFDENRLYNLEEDISETTNVADKNPDVVAQPYKQLEWAKKDIGDIGQRGENARPLGDEPYFKPNSLISVDE